MTLIITISDFLSTTDRRTMWYLLFILGTLQIHIYRQNKSNIGYSFPFKAFLGTQKLINLVNAARISSILTRIGRNGGQLSHCATKQNVDENFENWRKTPQSTKL